jgi:hypothetical protein
MDSAPIELGIETVYRMLTPPLGLLMIFFFPSIYDTKSLACSARCKYPPVPIRRSRRESELDFWDKIRGTVWSVKTTLPGSWRGALPTAHLELYHVQGVCDVPHRVDSRQNVSRFLCAVHFLCPKRETV